MQMYLINSYAQLALRACRQAISEEEVGCDGDAVCITDAVTDNNLSPPFSLNVRHVILSRIRELSRIRWPNVSFL